MKLVKFLEKHFWVILIILLVIGYMVYRSNEGFKTYNTPKPKKIVDNKQAMKKKEIEKNKKDNNAKKNKK